jgi:zinc protease
VSAILEGAHFGRAQGALLAQIERLRQDGISASELGKAVKQFVAGTLATRKTMQGQAQDLGANWLAAGDLNFSERYLATVKRAVPADLQRVARKYLTAENRTLYALVPKGVAPPARLSPTAAVDHPVIKVELANGLRLLLKEDHRLPFVEFRLVLGGGVLVEDAATNGSCRLLSRLLLQGTRRRTAEQVVSEIESLGGSLETYSGNNSLGVNAEVLAGDFATGLELVREVILEPVFPREALERERHNQLAALKAQRDQVLQVGAQLMRRALFGAHGYGLDVLGTEENLPRLEREQLAALHTRLATPRNAVLAIYGDIRVPEAQAAVDAAFGAWPSSTVGVPLAPFLPAAPGPETGEPGKPSRAGPERVLERVDKKQAVVLVGYPGVSIYHPDRFALELLAETCGDPGSDLFLRVRGTLGLAYFVGSQNFLGLMPGYFAFYGGTDPEKAAQLEAELVREAALLGADGLTEESLRRAKAKIVGQKKIARQDLGSLAQTHALDELYGLGYANGDADDARYEAVTLAQAKAAAQDYLQANVPVIAVVRPE